MRYEEKWKKPHGDQPNFTERKIQLGAFKIWCYRKKESSKEQ